MLTKVTFPPETPEMVFRYYIPQGGTAPFFVHLHFVEGFIYGVVAPTTILGITWHDQARFEFWVRDYTAATLAPKMDQLGRDNRLIYLSGSEADPKLDRVEPYQPVPETKVFLFDQALEFFYFPPMWVGSNPENGDGTIDFNRMKQRVFEQSLPTSGLKIGATMDGQFVLDFTDWSPGFFAPIEATSSRDKKILKNQAMKDGLRLAVANTFVVLLHATCCQLQSMIHFPIRVTPERIHRKRSLNSGGSGAVRANYSLDGARSHHGYRTDLPQRLDWRIVDRSVLPPIPLRALEGACTLLDSVLSLPLERGLTRVELYAHAATAYREYNFSLCLVQAWSAVESLLSEMWEEHLHSKDRELDEGGKLLSKDRKKYLLGRDFPTSMVTELLLLDQKIPDKLFAATKPVRSARNKWIHGLEAPSQETAQAALDVLELLLDIVCSLKIKLHHVPNY